MSKEIAQEWIEFAKQLQQEEGKLRTITDEQYKWFGQTMGMIKENSDWPTPSGTECRKWPRSFFSILKGGNEFVKEFLLTWATQSHTEFAMGCVHGNDALYDLIGYGVQPLFGDDYTKK
jgi:hypothetical protein